MLSSTPMKSRFLSTIAPEGPPRIPDFVFDRFKTRKFSVWYIRGEWSQAGVDEFNDACTSYGYHCSDFEAEWLFHFRIVVRVDYLRGIFWRIMFNSAEGLLAEISSQVDSSDIKQLKEKKYSGWANHELAAWPGCWLLTLVLFNDCHRLFTYSKMRC